MSFRPCDTAFRRRCVDLLDQLRRWGITPIELEPQRPKFDRDPAFRIAATWRGDGAAAQTSSIPGYAFEASWLFGRLTPTAGDAAISQPRRILGIVGFDARDSAAAEEAAAMKMLALATWAARNLAPAGYEIQAGDPRLLGDCMSRRGYGYRMAQLIEENVGALSNDIAFKALVDRLKSERADKKTEAFIDQYRKMVGHEEDAEAEQRVIGLFEGLLSMLDIQTYESDVDLTAFVQRLVEKAKFQRQCSDAVGFLEELRGVLLDAKPTLAKYRKAALKLGGEAGAARLEAFERVARGVEAMTGDSDKILYRLLPPFDGEVRYGGIAFTLQWRDSIFGWGGPWAASGASEPQAEAPDGCWAIYFDLDVLAKMPQTETPSSQQLLETNTFVRVLPLGDANKAAAVGAWWKLVGSRMGTSVDMSVEVDTSGRSLKRSLQQAVADKMTHVALLGDTEREQGKLTFKRLDDGKQVTLAADDPALAEFLELDVASPTTAEKPAPKKTVPKSVAPKKAAPKSTPAKGAKK